MTVTLRRTLITLCWLIITCSQSSHAKPLDWPNEHIPSALAPFDGQASAVAALAEQNILIYHHPRQATTTPTLRGVRRYQNVSFNSAALVVSAKPDQVRQLLS
ncbi:MAG: hypothetical protein VXW65_02185, partial [Pseudomonadota bacterium]|nr:hypothetical protein [Pseudomonadota bacterium]